MNDNYNLDELVEYTLKKANMTYTSDTIEDIKKFFNNEKNKLLVIVISNNTESLKDSGILISIYNNKTNNIDECDSELYAYNGIIIFAKEFPEQILSDKSLENVYLCDINSATLYINGIENKIKINRGVIDNELD